MRTVGMTSHFLLLFFLALTLWVGVTYVSQNIQYSNAKQFHSDVVQQLENHSFSAPVVEACRERAQRNGYQLTVEIFEEPSGDIDARVILDMEYVYPVIQIARHYTVEGYAR